MSGVSDHGGQPNPDQALAPRWRGARALYPIWQFNERCVDQLCELAGRDLLHEAPRIVMDYRELWTDLGSQARRHLARFPFVIVDAHFGSPEWWQAVSTETQSPLSTISETADNLPHEISQPLMLEVLMFAWHVAREDPIVAQVSFGMRPTVANFIATLMPKTICRIAEQEHGHLAVRWLDQSPLWADLLSSAHSRDWARLAELQLQAKLRFCSRLVR